MIAQLDQKCHMLKEDVDKAAMEELQKVACQVGLRISVYWAETIGPACTVIHNPVQVRTADNSASTGPQAGQEHAEAQEALFNRISQVIFQISSVY
jgi:hypothetical protein